VREYLLFGLRWRRRTRSEAVRVAGERDGGTNDHYSDSDGEMMRQSQDRVETESDRVRQYHYSDSDGEGEPRVWL
jgi:hypothetical protein